MKTERRHGVAFGLVNSGLRLEPCVPLWTLLKPVSEQEKEEPRDMPFCGGWASEIKSLFLCKFISLFFLYSQFILGTVTVKSPRT